MQFIREIIVTTDQLIIVINFSDLLSANLNPAIILTYHINKKLSMVNGYIVLLTMNQK